MRIYLIKSSINIRSMKKIFKQLIIILSMISMYSCLPDKFELDDISDIFITWSPLSIKVDGEVSLGDGSRGVTNRLWTFPGDGVCKIVGTNDLTSKEPVVHAVFYKSGIYKVRLQADFVNPEIKIDSLITITVLDK